MKIGLYDIDSKIPNLALMKLSAFHKNAGDHVEFYSPLLEYDKVYASKIFTDSDGGYLKDNMIIGGSGFDFRTRLSNKIEHIYPDYSLYDCKYAMGFITRGCVRECKFCIVPFKEGMIRKNADLEEFCKDQDKVMLLDNNILAYKHHIEELEKLRDSGKKMDFNQGLDIRLITKENATILQEIKRWKGLRYRFAFDNIELKEIIERKLTILNEVGITNGIIQFYVLIGFNSTPKEDLDRIKFLHEKKIDIFVMPFDKADPYQKKFARWVNRFFYKYISFKEFCIK